MLGRLATSRTRRVRRLQAEQLELRFALATFDVVNVLDSGPGSLRQAILDAQAMPGDDAIHFSIPGSGPHRIEPLSPLPAITGAGAVFLDASTQHGFEVAGVHPIELSGDGLDRDLYPTSDGLRIDGTTGSIIRGFTIHGFTNSIATHAAQGFIIEQNYLGLDPTGSHAPIEWVYQSVQENGVKVFGSTGTIGGASAESRNVISGHRSGILIQDAQNNIVVGNFLGTNAAGNAAIANQYGVQVMGPSANNRIGMPYQGNVVIATEASAWLHSGANHNVLQGNRMGFLVTGQAVDGGGIGMAHASSVANQIGGGGDGEGNLILGGISSGHGQNRIQGNWVGVSPDGTQRATWRISVLGSGNLIGTDGDGVNDDREGNVFANTVAISNDNVVAGNIFGLAVDGSAALTNVAPSFNPANSAGIYVDGARNAIGVSDAAGANDSRRNIIGGGFSYGIQFTSGAAVQNVVSGNFIGTDITGSIALPNAVGIGLGGFNNRVGTNADGINDSLEGNVISGNSLVGIFVGSQHVVAGNRIGTDVSGVLPLGNGVGIMLDGNDSQIGGSTLASRNTISGNIGSGIDVNNLYVTGNAVLGNAIGVNVLSEPLGNGLDGIWMRFGAMANVIGGVAAGEGNVIAYNQRNGVTVSEMLRQFTPLEFSKQNSIRGNSIHDNGGLGIDLLSLLWDGGGSPTDPLRNSYVFGPTPNDPLDSDSGNNERQNFPELSESTWGDSTSVTGQFQGKPLTEIVLDIYASAVTSNGYEGERWLGMTTVTTDAFGLAAFHVTGLGMTTAGEWITSTATDVDGNTSEFSLAIPATIPPNAAPVADAGEDQLRGQGEPVTFDASNSHDIDGAITGYVWDFGDGSSYSETQDNAPDGQFDGITIHTFQDNGAYAVTLDVADNGGEFSSDNLLITVTNVAPQVSVVTPAAALAGQNTNLAASFFDPGQAYGESYVVEVDWGDGQTTLGLIDSQTGAISSSHVYLSAGTYTLGVKVIDDGDHVSGQAASPLSGFATTHIQVIQPVRVDVQPDSIQVDSNGSLRVTLFGSAGFDVRSVLVSSVRFAGASASKFSFADQDHDGHVDLVLKIRTQDTVFDQIYVEMLRDDFLTDGDIDSTRQSTQLEVYGSMHDGDAFLGADAVDLFLSGKSLRRLLERFFFCR